MSVTDLQTHPQSRRLCAAMKLFSFLFIGNLKKYKAIQSEAVAKAMFIAAQKNYKEFHIIESDSIQEIANKKS